MRAGLYAGVYAGVYAGWKIFRIVVGFSHSTVFGETKAHVIPPSPVCNLIYHLVFSTRLIV